MAKFATTVATGVFVVLCLAGCSDDNGTGSDDPTPTAPTTSSTTSTPSPTVSAWQDKFTAEQLDAYDAALERWQEYSEKTNAIYRAGKDTPEARAVLREYEMQWQGTAVILAETYDKGGLRTIRPPKPLSWEAVSITDNVVVIRQCTDYTDVLVTKNGDELEGTKPDHLVTPLVIEMDKPDGRDWMVAKTDLKDIRACAA